MRIALDAMGSDNHPEPEVQGAVEAARLFGDEILLVGPQDRLTPLLQSAGVENGLVRIVHAPDVFEMGEKISGSAMRRAENSMGVGIDLVKNGEADAFVTAGNTGGAMSIGLARLGRLRGVKRPALCALFPVKGGQCVVLDIGANAECKPEYLLQFAQMGAVYAEKTRGVKNPRVSLLSNGEEPGKGSELVKAAYPLLQVSGLNFVGNVEGKEVYGGNVDVVVMDGFTGNVFLKTSEAVARLLTDTLREYLMSSLTTKVGAALARPAFRRLRRMMDPAEYGAVPLLGLAGLVFVGHGRSDARAMVNAIRVTREAVSVNLLDAIQTAIESRLENA